MQSNCDTSVASTRSQPFSESRFFNSYILIFNGQIDAQNNSPIDASTTLLIEIAAILVFIRYNLMDSINIEWFSLGRIHHFRRNKSIITKSFRRWTLVGCMEYGHWTGARAHKCKYRVKKIQIKKGKWEKRKVETHCDLEQKYSEILGTGSSLLISFKDTATRLHHTYIHRLSYNLHLHYVSYVCYRRQLNPPPFIFVLSVRRRESCWKWTVRFHSYTWDFIIHNNNKYTYYRYFWLVSTQALGKLIYAW